MLAGSRPRRRSSSGPSTTSRRGASRTSCCIASSAPWRTRRCGVRTRTCAPRRASGGLSGLTWSAAEMAQVLDLVGRVAPTDATVLIRGESGTGKEIIAKALHHASQRAAGRFVAINCGALPEPLLESEIFGHVKGAFTGAGSTKKGLFEEAHGGTLFLDEIGEMTPGLQVKLLRALQSGEVRPVGSTQVTTVDARVVAATNRDLEPMIRQGSF